MWRVFDWSRNSKRISAWSQGTRERYSYTISKFKHSVKYRNITEMLLFVGNALYDVTREEWWGNFLHGVNSGSSVTVLFLKPRLVTKTKRMVNVITRAGAIVKSKIVPKRTFGPRKIYGRYRGGVIRKKVGRPFLMRNIQLIGYIVSNLSWKWIEKFG